MLTSCTNADFWPGIPRPGPSREVVPIPGGGREAQRLIGKL